MATEIIIKRPITPPFPCLVPEAIAHSKAPSVARLLGFTVNHDSRQNGKDLLESAMVRRNLGNLQAEKSPGNPKAESFFLTAQYLEEAAKGGLPAAFRFLVAKDVLTSRGSFTENAPRLLQRGTEMYDQDPQRISQEIVGLPRFASLPQEIAQARERLDNTYTGVKEALALSDTTLIIEDAVNSVVRSSTRDRTPVTAVFGGGTTVPEAFRLIRSGHSLLLVDLTDSDSVQSGLKNRLKAKRMAEEKIPQFIQGPKFPDSPISFDQELIELLANAGERQTIITVQGNYALPFSGKFEGRVNNALSCYSFHHNSPQDQAQALANFSLLANNTVSVLDANREGQGFSRVVMPVGLYLAIKYGMAETHGDALISFANGTTVKEMTGIIEKSQRLSGSKREYRVTPSPSVPRFIEGLITPLNVLATSRQPERFQISLS